MDAVREDTEARDTRFDSLRAEASEAVGYSTSSLRHIRVRYREAYAEALRRRAAAQEALDAAASVPGGDDDKRVLRTEVELLTADLGVRQTYLAKLELAERTLEDAWLLVEHGDSGFIREAGADQESSGLSMRVLDAQEGERSRLAREVHDGPAQTLTNSIFQVEFIERVFETDPDLARTEIRALRDLLRRELGDIRSFIVQLRPLILDERGLNGAIEETAEHVRGLSGLTITTRLTDPGDELEPADQTVILRVVQEALQNVRKHAAAASVVVASDREGSDWIVEIADDGRGFDVGSMAARGRRNFGLQFMRERAELIGARFNVRSQQDGGTVVRIAIPTRSRAGKKESI